MQGRDKMLRRRFCARVASIDLAVRDRPMRTVYLLAVISGICLATPRLVAANEIGRWRMPSTICQAAGFGYGPGRHAPIVRAPGYRTPPPPRVVMTPRGVQPFCPQAYRSINGCVGPWAGAACSSYGGFHDGGPTAYDAGAEWSAAHGAGPYQLGPPTAPPVNLPSGTMPPKPAPAPSPAMPEADVESEDSADGPAAPPSQTPTEPLPQPTDRQAWRPTW